MIPVIIEKSGINLDKKVNEINKKERHRLVNLLKNFEVTIKGFRSIDEAIITSGGINIKEINPKTMESKLVEGLDVYKRQVKHYVTEVVAEEAYFADSKREGDMGAGAFENTFGSTMPGSMGSYCETSSADDLPF